MPARLRSVARAEEGIYSVAGDEPAATMLDRGEIATLNGGSNRSISEPELAS